MEHEQPTPPPPTPEPTAVQAGTPPTSMPTPADTSIAEVPAPTPPTEPPPPPWEWTPALQGLAALTLLFAFLLGSFRAFNTDIWMTLATGKLLAQGAYSFGVDPFSWASAGAYWANASWLGSWIAYALYAAFGPDSLVVAKAALVAGIAALLILTRTPRTSVLPTIVLTTLAVLAASQRFLLQTTVFSFLGLAVLVCLLTRGGYLTALPEGDRPRRAMLWQVPLLFLVWSNLDPFYLIGLATLMLSAIGLLVVPASRVGGIRLAAALGLSMVACALNPHLLANFTLPNELAYLLQDVLPGRLAAAGTTYAALAEGDRSFYPLWSPFSSEYLGGANVAVVSFFVLLLLNVASVVLAGMRPATYGLAARSLICLTLGVAACVLERLVPFYVLVAAPLSVLNWDDFLRGSRAEQPAGEAAWAGPAFAGVALALGIALVWPGWLHLAFTEFREDRLFQGSRRVSWELTPDMSIRDAALALETWRQAKDVGNVFNMAPDIAHYCAFFAPDVRCGVDLRLALFADVAPAYAAARNELWKESVAFLQPRGADTKRPATRWPEQFQSWGVDCIAATNYHRSGNTRNGPLVTRMLYQPRSWLPRYVDGRTLLFRWSPTGSWSGDELRKQWAAEAFGPLPPEAMLPENEAIQPATEPGWLEQYLHGSQPTPLAAHTAAFELGTYQKVVLEWKRPFFQAWLWAQQLPAAGMSGAAPGGVLAIQAAWSSTVLPMNILGQPYGPEPDHFHSLDYGPPALPVLVQRELRRALLENPRIGFTHAMQARALKTTMEQEAWWARHQALNARTRVRNIQVAAALHNALTLTPDNVDLHFEFAEKLLAQNYLDAALAEIERGIQALETLPVSDPNYLKAVRKKKEEMDNQSRAIRQEVQRRKADLDLQSAGKPDIERFRLAMHYPWRFVGPDNKEHVDPNGRGLVLEAIRVLERINPLSLQPAEKLDRNYFLVMMYANLGRIDDAVRTINKAGSDLAAAPGAECRLWVSAATGWYGNVDEALQVLEKGLSAEIEDNRKRPDTIPFAGMSQSLLLVNQPSVWPRILPSILADQSFTSQRAMAKQIAQRPEVLRADFRTLRGLFALERGDTGTALRHFEEAVGLGVAFSDEPIARRYRDLLREHAR